MPYLNNKTLRSIVSGDTKGLIGDEPKPIAKSQKEIDAANDFAKKFAAVHAKAIANDAYVARNIGDPLPQVIDQQTGQLYNGKYSQMPQSMIKPLPDWVTELKWDKQWGQPYYLDGNDIVYVDKKHFNSPKFLKTNTLQGLVASK